MDIAIVYQGDEWKCGPGTWTTNLFNGLKVMGYHPAIIRIGRKYNDLEIGNVVCHTMPMNDVLDICRELPSIISITHMFKYMKWIYNLIEAGCALVYHTKNTNRYSDEFHRLLYDNKTQIIAVRPAIRDYVISKGLKPENVTYIPHVYIPKGPLGILRTKNAVCTTRIAAWKNVDIIMEANEILYSINGDMDDCVYLHGYHNKSYMRKKIIGKINGWDDYKYLTGPMYPSCNQGFANGRGYDICSRAGYAVDLTNFPGDNADLQYCALEMIDAGCVYIGHTKYIDGEILRPNHNCLSVGDPYELAEILMTSYKNYQDLVGNAKELLEKHKPENVIHYYDDLFDRLDL